MPRSPGCPACAVAEADPGRAWQPAHQAVGRSEENGVAGFHQAVAQGAQGVGFAGAGQSEGQYVDAALDEAALGQMIQLLPQRQGDWLCSKVSQVLPEGSLDSRRSRLSAGGSDPQLPAPARKMGRASPWPAAVKRVRLGAHRGQLELAAQLADAVLYHAGCAHPRRGQAP